MFLLSSCYWLVSVVNIALKIRRIVHITDLVKWESIFPLFNAIIYLNVSSPPLPELFELLISDGLKYVLGDAIVVWRAWTLALPAKKKLLAIPIVCLAVTFGKLAVFLLKLLTYKNSTSGHYGFYWTSGWVGSTGDPSRGPAICL